MAIRVYAHEHTRIRVLEFAYFAYVLVRLFSSGTVDSERRLNIKYQLIVTCTMYVLYRSWTCSGLMVGILDSGWSHQGLSPGRSHSDCLCSWARHF